MYYAVIRHLYTTQNNHADMSCTYLALHISLSFLDFRSNQNQRPAFAGKQGENDNKILTIYDVYVRNMCKTYLCVNAMKWIIKLNQNKFIDKSVLI